MPERNTPWRLLIADDEYHICEGLREGLSRDDCAVDVAHDGNEAAALLDRHRYHAAIFDLRMPGMDGLSLLRRAKAASPETGVIIVTAFGEIATAVDAMRLGAYDYVTKPLDLKRLRLSVQHVLERHALLAENRKLKARLDASAFDQVVHRSPVMQKVCDTIAQAASTDVPVLIRGETGTGKELVARAIHQQSARAKGPLVATNCGAIPETLFETDLFGHVRGAFTGAVGDRPGRFAAASGGTLFLDEVGEIPLTNQEDLLRVLEEKAFTPVGSTKPVPADVRMIFATNRDLEAEVRQGRFREDLYYRINVVPIRVPPLRERKEDIPLLVDAFLEQLCALHGKEPKRFTEEAMARILSYAWPGNVRELKNAVERLVVTCPSVDVDAADLPSRVRQAEAGPGVFTVELGRSIADVERDLIEQTLRHVTQNRKEAAGILGISVRSLQYKLKKLNLSQREQKAN